MRLATVLWRVCVILCLFLNKTLGDSSSGTFTINDNGVQGEGRYIIINGVTEIGLRLVIGTVTNQTKSNDGGVATITSLPTNTETSTPLSPNNEPTSSFHPSGGPSSSLPSNRGPNVLPTSNTGSISSFSPNNGPSMSRPPGNEPSTPLPSSNEAANPTPEVTLTPEDDQFIDDMVASHNQLRSVHFSPPIQNNTQMSLAAKKLALRLASEKDLRHSPPSERPNEGESLAMGCTTAPGEGISATEAIKKWYEEACCEDFSNHAFQNISGHFSQLVWKATEEIGVGRAFGSKWGMNCTFIVARYKPNGNIDGEATFKDNVDKGTFDPITYNCSNVNCRGIAGEESQVKQAPGKSQQQNGLSDKSNDKAGANLPNKAPQSYYSNMQRYRDLYYKSSKGLNAGIRNRGVNSYVNLPGVNANPLVSRYLGYRLNSLYNKGQRLPEFFSNDMKKDEIRPRSIEYRAKIPHTSIIMQRDKKVVWFLL